MKKLKDYLKLSESVSLESRIMEIWGDKIDKLSIYESGDNIELSMIELKKDSRRSGIGTKIMKYMTSYADSYNKIIHLTPDPSRGTNINTLKSFYMKHGFIFNRGVNKDFRFKNIMIRYPQ